MFTQSMVSNTSGNDSTKAANFARARAEELMQYPFNHPDLTIENGTEKTLHEYYTASDASVASRIQSQPGRPRMVAD